MGGRARSEHKAAWHSASKRELNATGRDGRPEAANAEQGDRTRWITASQDGRYHLGRSGFSGGGEMTVEDLTKAFGVHLAEMDRCQTAGAYWGLLHLVVVIPDICAKLEREPNGAGGNRYVAWCGQNFPQNPHLTGGDRYQIRNAVLHAGSSLAENVTAKSSNQTQYSSFSFVDPISCRHDVHQEVSADGKNLTLDVGQMAAETREALQNWFTSLQSDGVRMQRVTDNLHRVVRVQEKQSQTELLTAEGSAILTADRHPVFVPITFNTTSST
jgi:hypothetical protein